MADPIDLPLDNDFDWAVRIRKRNISSHLREPASGLTTLKVRLATTKNGAAINAALDLVMNERAGNPGIYYATWTGDLLRTHLAGLVGQTIYIVFYSTSNTKVKTNTAAIVRETRDLAA